MTHDPVIETSSPLLRGLSRRKRKKSVKNKDAAGPRQGEKEIAALKGKGSLFTTDLPDLVGRLPRIQEELIRFRGRVMAASRHRWLGKRRNSPKRR